MNRVLTLEEVIALRPGADVLIEFVSVVPCRSGRVVDTAEGVAIKDNKYDYMWPRAESTAKSYGKYYRVWSLPVAPTPDELAEWPWEKEGGNASAETNP